MERAGSNEPSDLYGKQGTKRFLLNDEYPSNKRRKFASTWSQEESTSSFAESQARRNPTFANDRLKRLRDQIKTDVVPLSTTVNSDILKNAEKSSWEYSGRKYIVPCRKRNKNQPRCPTSVSRRITASEEASLIYNDNSKINPIKENERSPVSSKLKETIVHDYNNKKVILDNLRNNDKSIKTDQLSTDNKSQGTSSYKKNHIELKVETTVSVPFSRSSRNEMNTMSMERMDNKFLPQRKIPQEAHGVIENKTSSSGHKYINPASIFLKNKDHAAPYVPSEKNENLGPSVSIVRNCKDVPHNRSFNLSGRTVESKNGLFNISVPNFTKLYSAPDRSEVKMREFCGNHKQESENKFDSFNSSPISKNNSRDKLCGGDANSRLSNLRNCLRQEKRTRTTSDSSINILPSAFVSTEVNTPCKEATFVQERLRNNRFSPINPRRSSFPVQKHTDKYDTFHVPKDYGSINHPTIFQNERVDHSKTESVKSSSNSCSNNNSRNKFEESSKYWINYGQIVDSLYRKYFSSLKKDEATVFGSRNGDGMDATMDWDDDDEEVNEFLNLKSESDEGEGRELYIVVDTNIFLKDLSVLKEIVSCGSSGGTKPVLYVPWMVLSELDFMKEDKNTPSHLKSKVEAAVHFINKTLVEGNRKLIGQNVFEADKQNYVGKSPDDKIVACCLQSKEKFHNVILLSNDVNLKNKLLVNGIPALSTTEMIRNTADNNSTKEVTAPAKTKLVEGMQKVLEEMSSCCSLIICECAKEAYGTIWNKMAMLNDPPWSLKVCLRIFKRYWSSVFRERLLKQCSKSVEQLSEILKELEMSKNADKFEEFVQGCMSLCFFFKDLEQHRDFVEGTIRKINSVTNSQ